MEELKKALKYANGMTSSTYELAYVLSTFKDLAERVLAVKAKPLVSVYENRTHDTITYQSYELGWNACREAILKGGSE